MPVEFMTRYEMTGYSAPVRDPKFFDHLIEKRWAMEYGRYYTYEAGGGRFFDVLVRLRHTDERTVEFEGTYTGKHLLTGASAERIRAHWGVVTEENRRRYEAEQASRAAAPRAN
jgi:hypothetical protein